MITLRLEYQHVDCYNDVQDVPRAFSPYLIIDENSNNYLKWEYSNNEELFTVSISSNIWGNIQKSINIKSLEISDFKKITKRFIKVVLYDYLCEELQIRLPYGSLTGVRPTKLYYELSKNLEHPTSYLIENLRVLPEKAQLIENCVKNQKNYINRSPKDICIFLNIPFCPTRCTYCSFISTEVFRIKNELPFYVECVKKELELVAKIIKENGYNVRSIYIGGGTPTSVGAAYLEDMILPLSCYGVEFTVEAGRPDTINEEVINVLKKANVTRVSINPQTFKQSTLDIIGRGHSVEEVYRAYEVVNNAGFDVNMDLIAGLPGESFEDFANSIDECINLAPANITIHTLSMKRGSILQNAGVIKDEFGPIKSMVDYGHESLNKAGYVPYYMYRQKNTFDNLENTGYCVSGKQCSYNIDMMEETATILAVGAGGMSKKIMGDRIERLSNCKGFREYCQRIDQSLEKKYNFFR